MPGLHQTQLYCLADRRYYETPARLQDESTRYPLDSDPPGEGWRRVAGGLWTSLLPEDREPAGQGWKIHVSTVPEEAEETLLDTARICRAHGVPFKFLRSERALLLMSGKYMSRAGAGKFITVYPPDETVFLRVLDELTRALAGRRGLYILSDLRIGDAPVYVRYGAFVSRWCLDEDGERVLALRHPSGELVPDERGVVFRVPPWVTVPDALRPHLAARAAAGDAAFPYDVSEALQFSNAGGIYLARHRETGRQVVLREARPHSGLDEAGDDAVTRLHREHRALTALAGLDCVPEVYGVRTVWEHHFLIEEHIEGATLLEEIVSRFALLHSTGTTAELAPYIAWVDSVTERLTEALAAVHGRGLRFGDLHPNNIIIRPDGRVALIDFEYATALDDRDTPVAGAPGLQAPAGTVGAEADAYALWATWLYMLMPIMEMAGHDRAKALTLERWARRRYGLDAGAGPQPALGAAGRREHRRPREGDRRAARRSRAGLGRAAGEAAAGHPRGGDARAHRPPLPRGPRRLLDRRERRRARGGRGAPRPAPHRGAGAARLDRLARRHGPAPGPRGAGRPLRRAAGHGGGAVRAGPPRGGPGTLRAVRRRAPVRLGRPDERPRGHRARRAAPGPAGPRGGRAARRQDRPRPRRRRGPHRPRPGPAGAGRVRAGAARARVGGAAARAERCGPAPPRTARPDRRRAVPGGRGPGPGGGGGPLRDHAGRHRPGEGRPSGTSSTWTRAAAGSPWWPGPTWPAGTPRSQCRAGRGPPRPVTPRPTRHSPPCCPGWPRAAPSNSCASRACSPAGRGSWPWRAPCRRKAAGPPGFSPPYATCPGTWSPTRTDCSSRGRG